MARPQCDTPPCYLSIAVNVHIHPKNTHTQTHTHVLDQQAVSFSAFLALLPFPALGIRAPQFSKLQESSLRDAVLLLIMIITVVEVDASDGKQALLSLLVSSIVVVVGVCPSCVV